MSTEGKGSVLVVDDTPENIRVLGEILELDGYEVYIAESGPRALEILGGVQVDLILLDIMMPEMDGYQVCHKLKSIPQLMAVPVVFLTALGSPEHELKGMEAGAVDYISKPFNVELVKARVKTHVDLYRYRSRLEDLVEKRTTQLAQAYQNLQILEAARRDLLQLLYKKLWEPKSGLFSLTEKLLSQGSFSLNEKNGYAARLEAAKEGLVKVINSGLFLRSPDEAEAGTSVAVPLKKVLEKCLEGRQEFILEESDDPLIAGNLDLVYFILLNLIETSHLMTEGSGKIQISLGRDKSYGQVNWEFETNQVSPQEAAYFFNPEQALWAKTPALKLSQEIVLSVRIVQIMNGSLVCTAADQGKFRFTLSLPTYEEAEKGVFIKL